MSFTKITGAFIAANTITADNIASNVSLGGDTSPRITSIGYPGDDTAADTAGGQTITINGANFANGAAVYLDMVAVGSATVVNANTITITAPARATGSYVVYVINADGGTAIHVPGIQYSGVPAWTTAAGSLGTVYETTAYANTVTATGDAPVTYSLASGSLPPGATLAANGQLSGTANVMTGSTTYNFTVRATDAQNQDTDRAFSLTVASDVVTWSSPANGAIIELAQDAPSGTTLSATSAAGYNVTYSANTLPTGLSISGSSVTGTPTVSGNTTTLLTATANTTNRTATRTVTWVVTLAVDPFRSQVVTHLSPVMLIAPYNADASNNNFAVTASGDVRPNNLNPYTPGFYSAFFDGNGDYLTTSTGTPLNLSTGQFTVELWVWHNNAGSEEQYLDSSTNGFSLAKGTNNLVNVAQSGVAVFITSNVALAAGRWNHIAVTRDGSNVVTLWINGVSAGTSTTGRDFTNNTFHVGRQAGQAVAHLNGFISNLRIIKGSAIYSSNFTAPTAPLTAISGTSLLACQSNRLLDSSTNNFTITRVGDVRVSGFAPFTPNPSFSTYGSTYFDGTGDFLNSNTSTATAFGTGDYTIEAWIYRTDTGVQRAIVDTRGADATGVLFYITNERLNLFDSSTVYLTSTSTIPTHQWVHVAVTRQSGTTRLFLNGAVDATLSNDTRNNSTGASGCFIGRQLGSTVNDFFGYMSNVRIVKGTAVYTTAFTPPTQPLTAISGTSLLTCQTDQPINNHSFIDNSTNNLLTTRTGNVSQGTFSPYGENWSNHFDGNGDFLTLAPGSAFAFGTGAFTVEAWVFPRAQGSSSQGGFYFIDARNSGQTGAWAFSTNLDDTVGAGFRLDWFDGSSVMASSGVLNQNAWNHVVYSRSGTTGSLFLNGTRVGTRVDSVNYSVSPTISYIGARHSIAFQLNGYLSNVRVVKGTAVYNPALTTLTVPTTPLAPIANTVLLTCADNRFIDDSPNNFAITRNGDVSTQEFGPFPGTALPSPAYSVYFDGTGDSLTVPNSGTFNFGAPSGNTNDFCIEFWAYQNNTSITNLVGTAYSAGINNYWAVGTNRRGTDGANIAGTINFYMTDSFYIESASGFNTNVWNHVVACRTGTTVSLFLNGTRVATGTSSGSPNATGLLQIGGEPSQLGRHLNGFISNLRITRGSTQPYSATSTSITVPTSTLAAITNTNLLACQDNTVIDNSTNNFAITVNGDIRPTRFNPFTPTYSTRQSYTPAVFGGSGYFDGNSDFLRADASTTYGTLPASGSFTIEGWFYFTDMSLNQQIIFTQRSSTNPYVPYLIWTSGTSLSLYVSSDNGSWNIINNDTIASGLTAGQWYHFAYTRNGSTFRFFVNGVQTYTFTSTAAFNNTGTFNLGMSPGETNTPLRGYVSDVRFINGTSLYNARFVPPPAPLTAVRNTVALFNMASAGIYDSASLANFETTGDAKLVTSPRQYSNTSIYFDGTGDSLTIPGNPNLDFGTGNFTIEFWWYPNAIGFQPLVYHTNSSTVTGIGHYGIVNTTGNGLRFYYNGGGTGTVSQGSQTGTTAGQWYHIAVVRNSGTITIYRNGVSVASGPNNLQVGLASNPMTIGSGENGFTNSYISDLRITRGVARYTANFTPPTAALLTS